MPTNIRHTVRELTNFIILTKTLQVRSYYRFADEEIKNLRGYYGLRSDFSNSKNPLTFCYNLLLLLSVCFTPFLEMQDMM